MSRRYPAIAAAVIFVAIAGASATPALAQRPLSTPNRSAQADAIVARLRDLPLPLRAFPRGTASTQAAQQPLPALELRRQKIYDQLHVLGPASVPALVRARRSRTFGRLSAIRARRFDAQRAMRSRASRRRPLLDGRQRDSPAPRARRDDMASGL